MLSRTVCASGRSHPGPGEASSDTAREASPAASLSWWFGHPTANIHLQLPLLFSAFETKIQFPREVCGVVTRRVLLACFKRRGGAGQGEKFHPRLWPELPFREQAGKMGQSVPHTGGVSPSHTSFHHSFPPRCKKRPDVTPCQQPAV